MDAVTLIVTALAAGAAGSRSEAVAYDVAGEVTGGPAGAPESGTPA
jgi:hypothetical protein